MKEVLSRGPLDIRVPSDYDYFMERKTIFTEGEAYHIYTRGVEKRVIFKSNKDYSRFMTSMFLCNGDKPAHFSNIAYQGDPLINLPDKEPIVHILAYTLMPNHIHLILREIVDGGISRYMLKLLTAYSMFFNIKHERSGPLFVRPFRSQHIDSEEYFQWVLSYVLLNPLELFQADWKEKGVRNPKRAKQFMRSYAYSAFIDYFVTARPAARILNKNSLPFRIKQLRGMDDLLEFFGSVNRQQQININ